MVFSPDGKLVALGDNDGIIRVWQLPTGRELFVLKGHPFGITCLAISADGKMLASSGSDETIRLWALTTGRSIKNLGRIINVRSLDFSPDGKLVASGSLDGTIRIFETATGKQIHRISLPMRRFETRVDQKVRRYHFTPSVLCLDFSPTGRFLALGSGFLELPVEDNGCVRLWNVKTAKMIDFQSK